MCLSISAHITSVFNNRELVTTIKELEAIATAAQTGDSNTPYLGNKTPAAMGIAKKL
jgi:hypothetical protein